jgi:hypothetical protein
MNFQIYTVNWLRVEMMRVAGCGTPCFILTNLIPGLQIISVDILKRIS